MVTFYLYIEAIFANWWAFMMACPFILDETIKWIFPKGKLWLEHNLAAGRRRRVEVALMIFGVFLAGFLAFKDEHAARIKAETTVSQPDKRTGVRKQLQQFYVAGGAFIDANLPKDISEEDFKAYEYAASQWANNTANWIAEHLGPAARRKFLDKPTPRMVYSKRVNDRHDYILNTIDNCLRNLSTLMETSTYDDVNSP